MPSPPSANWVGQEKLGSFGESEKIETMFANALEKQKGNGKEKEKEKEKVKGKNGEGKEKDQEKSLAKGGTKRKRWEVEQIRRGEQRKSRGTEVSEMKREVLSDGDHECPNCLEVFSSLFSLLFFFCSHTSLQHFRTIAENIRYMPLHATDQCPHKLKPKQTALTPPVRSPGKWKVVFSFFFFFSIPENLSHVS